MSDVIIIPEEKPLEEPTEKTAIEEAIEIVEVATVIAEKIEEAGEDDRRLIDALDKLDRVIFTLDSLVVAVADMKSSQVEEAVIVAEVIAEVIEEPSTEVVENIADEVVEEIKEEVVPVATTPQIRKKKSAKWI